MSLRLTIGRLTARARRLAARHRWMRWIPVSACAVGLVTAAHAHATAADATKAAWGELRPVWVARRDVEPGETIDAALTPFPIVAVPEAALDDETPVGKVAVQRIGAGEVLTTADVGSDGELSLLPAGWRAVAVTESPTSGAVPGDGVDVVSEGVVLVEDAVVVAELDGSVLIGAPASIAPLIALANEVGVALLRTGMAGPPAP